MFRKAPGLDKPVHVMRAAERPEALKSGTVHLVDTNHDLIVSEVSTLLDDPVAHDLELRLRILMVMARPKQGDIMYEMSEDRWVDAEADGEV